MARLVKVKDKQTGKRFEFHWDLPRNPTDAEMSQIHESQIRGRSSMNKFRKEQEAAAYESVKREHPIAGRLQRYLPVGAMHKAQTFIDEPTLPELQEPSAEELEQYQVGTTEPRTFRGMVITPTRYKAPEGSQAGRDIYEHYIRPISSPGGIAAVGGSLLFPPLAPLPLTYYGGRAAVEFPGAAIEAVRDPSPETIQRALMTGAFATGAGGGLGKALKSRGGGRVVPPEEVAPFHPQEAFSREVTPFHPRGVFPRDPDAVRFHPREAALDVEIPRPFPKTQKIPPVDPVLLEMVEQGRPLPIQDPGAVAPILPEQVSGRNIADVLPPERPPVITKSAEKPTITPSIEELTRERVRQAEFSDYYRSLDRDYFEQLKLAREAEAPKISEVPPPPEVVGREPQVSPKRAKPVKVKEVEEPIARVEVVPKVQAPRKFQSMSDVSLKAALKYTKDKASLEALKAEAEMRGLEAGETAPTEVRASKVDLKTTADKAIERYQDALDDVLNKGESAAPIAVARGQATNLGRETIKSDLLDIGLSEIQAEQAVTKVFGKKPVGKPSERGSIRLTSGRYPFEGVVKGLGELRGRINKSLEGTSNDAARSVVTLRKAGSEEAATAMERASAEIKKPGPLNQIFRDSLESFESQIKRQGIAGKEVAKLRTFERVEGERRAGNARFEAKRVARPLSREEFNGGIDRYDIVVNDKGKIVEAPGQTVKSGNFVDVIEKGDAPMNERVRAAVEEARKFDDTIVTPAEQSGMGLRTVTGKVIPFKRRPWPHFGHVFAERFLNKANKKGAVREAIIKDIMSNMKNPSRTSAENLLTKSRLYGEILIDAQHQRVFNTTGWERTPEAYAHHYADLARRTNQAEVYGPKDIAEAKSRLGSLLEDITKEGGDQSIPREMFERELSRKDKSPRYIERQIATGKMSRLMAWMHLSRFAIGNPNQLARIPLKSNMLEFSKAMKQVITDWRGASNVAEVSGALEAIHKEALFEAGKRGGPTKYYAIEASERFNRTVSAVAGRGYAQALFNDLVRKPEGVGSKMKMRKLQDLILEDPKVALKRGYLTDAEVQRAGGRMSEATQGRAEPFDLPPYWSSDPLIKFYVLYKRYAYRDTVNIRKMLVEDPVRNIPLYLALSQVFGEVTGDIKRGIEGAAVGTITGEGAGEVALEEIARRGEYAPRFMGKLVPLVGEDVESYLEEHPLQARAVDNMIQSWALGLFADAARAWANGKYGMLEFLAGAPGSVAVDVTGAGRESLAKKEVTPLAREALRKAPLVGGAVQREVLPTEGQKRGKRRGIRRPQIPSVPAPPGI